jgi:hypothetical protein
MKKFLTIICLIASTSLSIFAQNATISGVVKDEYNRKLEFVNIAVENATQGAVSNSKGEYTLIVPANKDLRIHVTYVGYEEIILNVNLNEGENRVINHTLVTKSVVLDAAVIEDKLLRRTTMQRINPKVAIKIPSVSGSVEALVMSQPGVASSSELSSQYSVRGGNYDENLVYVNDIEIYRPLLIRSGEQEGLSFLNPDLVSSVLFSAGGFAAKYGDKMSSALDIKYKKPTEFAASTNLTLTGANGHVEGISKNKKFSYLLGVRQKSNQYILRSLPTKGDYKPSFTDLQTYLSYKFSEKWSFDVLGYYANNKYNFVPSTRETDFGTFQDALRLTIFFEGQEVDRFESYMGAGSLKFQPNKDTKLTFTGSAYRSIESETYDILGQYWLGLLDNSPGDEEYGEVVESMGVGTFLNHARNFLDAKVYNIQHRGIHTTDISTLEWGAKYQREMITDELKEWEMLDSAFYSLPYQQNYTPGVYHEPQDLVMNKYLESDVSLNSNRYEAYVQNSWDLDGDSTEFRITTGIRASYWDVNKQFLLSPRVQIAYKPNWENDFMFRLSGGIYHQPPFYRELRDLEGNINKDVLAQSSYHIVLGSDYNFYAWGRPFKYVTEIYYKKMWNLIPYEIDNVRLRYYANNNSEGYATGIDMKINGEFVPGVESWASLSIMDSKENIEGDWYINRTVSEDPNTGEEIVNEEIVETGYRPRPARQNVVLNIFFQDYLPINPTYKMNLNFIFATGIPKSYPGTKNYKPSGNFPAYRRVDIGFAKQIKDESYHPDLPKFFDPFKSIWISLEVFNLLDINNTISYMYVSDIYNRQLPVPNYLTPRQLNLKLSLEF